MLKKLEANLKHYLKVKHVWLVSSGTIALQIAIKSLDLKKEIITTPFSYIATTSSIVWAGCKPVFVDINPKTLNVDTDKIEQAINKNTEAILVTHIYGNPCDIEKIQGIADKHNLKVIYDAAHAFGTKYKGKHLVNFGDTSILSFHATKLFHTIEGGAIVTNNARIAKKIWYMRNFGHKGQEDFWGLGINGKNSEFHAAMGLCVLPKVNQLIKYRRDASELYDTILFARNLNIRKPEIGPNTFYNYSYYPIILPSEKVLMKIKSELGKQNIFPRRYFYPSLDTLHYVKSKPMKIARDISRRILCLPLSFDLTRGNVRNISQIIITNLK